MSVSLFFLTGSADHAFNPLTPKEFASLIGGTKAVLIQVRP